MTLEKLLEKLGVDHVLSPYETQPWFHYDTEKEITCSAEVRMGPGGEDVEVEVQFLQDEKETGESEEDKGEEGKANEGDQSSGGREQIMHMRALPVAVDQWSPTTLCIKGKNYVNEIYNWEEKGCNFFRACIEAVSMGVLPDIDALVKKELNDDDGSRGGGRKGKIGRKSPTIKPGQLLGMKK